MKWIVKYRIFEFGKNKKYRIGNAIILKIKRELVYSFFSLHKINIF